MLIKKNLIVKERRSLLTMRSRCLLFNRSKYPCIQCIFKSTFDPFKATFNPCMYNNFCKKLKYNYYISRIYYVD